MTMDRDFLVSLIAQSLKGARVPLSDEKEAQRIISELLAANGIEHKREHHLGDGDIPDFFCPPDLVIEVKMNRTHPANVYKQLVRYARHATVGALILITNRAMGLPACIGDKPAYFISLGRAWL